MSRGPGRGRKLRREENLEVTFGAEGLQSVRRVEQAQPTPTAGAGEYGEPCYSCDCCLKWTETLELLRGHVVAHVKRAPALFPCPDECLVCASTTWTGEPA